MRRNSVIWHAGGHPDSWTSRRCPAIRLIFIARSDAVHRRLASSGSEAAIPAQQMSFPAATSNITPVDPFSDVSLENWVQYTHSCHF